jgi:phospholipid/cholesterol/gamma-HCH transport system permease protein
LMKDVRAFGKPLQAMVEWAGDLGLFCWRVAKAIFSLPFEGAEFLRQLDAIGARSLPLACLAGAATGVVLSLQTGDSLTRFGAKSLLPTVIVYSLLKETGPIIASLIVCGRVGAGIGAELGSMRVTDQIDAMEASAVDPYKYLVATRVLACIVAMPLLTVATDFVGVLMGWVASSLADPMPLTRFLSIGFKGATFSDILPPTFKTAIFGLIIGAVACFQGMRTRGGTEGVGRSATSSVVLASLFIMLADVVLVRLIIEVF